MRLRVISLYAGVAICVTRAFRQSRTLLESFDLRIGTWRSTYALSSFSRAHDVTHAEIEARATFRMKMNGVGPRKNHTYYL